MANLACTPVLEPTGATCDRDQDCAVGSLCFESASTDSSIGECLSVSGQCLELEVSDVGDRYGSDCTPGTTTCAGTCVPIDESGAECEEPCRVGEDSGCGLEFLQGNGVACAYFAYDLSALHIEQGAGDVGICAKLCNCHDECPGSQLCLDSPTDGYRGICTGGIDSDEAIQCEKGMGGAGGVP